MNKATNKNRLLFGAPDADSDLLLKDCLIEGQVGRYSKPILIGRWGTGKSANLIARARTLESVLEKVDPLSKRDWYIKEQHISTHSLFELHKQHAESASEGYFISQIQEVWKSEINQRVIRVLALLARSESVSADVSSAHWKSVLEFGKYDFALESMWNFVDDILSIIFRKDGSKATDGFRGYYSMLRSAKIERSIQRCILDLEAADQPVPMIGIEPIETPTSNLDSRVNMAECVIAALLNVYRNDYVINDRQRVQVFLSLPWNRTANKKINLPQHIKPLMEEIRWTKENLRKFISRRIEWELNGRSTTRQFRAGLDAWDAIFPKTIENRSCDREHGSEFSFDYVLRHTQWRARDIQTVSRECVLTHCNNESITVGSFFRSRQTLPEKVVMDCVAKFSQDTAKLRLEEARRRFSSANQTYFEQDAISSALRGINVPMSETDLRKRLSPAGDYQRFADILNALWESGIVGIHISCADDKYCRVIETSYPQAKSRHVYSKNERQYFLFHYNTDKTPQHLKDGFDKETNDINLKYILHPCFFENLECHVSNPFPLGV
ncbi:hypothetical protein U5922_006840 [Aquicoccus sp. G2-2]|uniref:hypothetical protein n=1 Tax=Aquicoccus sp. G2-2 TaxID=3092120 RepID=UPI002AE0115F|nr:hypothetical protein [Aquicoccus sp. G2-2]MEA1113206.1 hypothetical protein [Aquicoccus sp. G2-2]